MRAFPVGWYHCFSMAESLVVFKLRIFRTNTSRYTYHKLVARIRIWIMIVKCREEAHIVKWLSTLGFVGHVSVSLGFCWSCMCWVLLVMCLLDFVGRASVSLGFCLSHVCQSFVWLQQALALKITGRNINCLISLVIYYFLTYVPRLNSFISNKIKVNFFLVLFSYRSYL